MSTRLVFAALFSAALLSSCSSETPSDIRPEVAQPLMEAAMLAHRGDQTFIMVKLNQAASVPNLNKDEQDKIRKVTAFLDSKLRNQPGSPVGNDILKWPGQTFGTQ
jgi:hypothetical protein